MTQAAADSRLFSVRARHADAHEARVLEESSFEAAAVAYLEDLSVQSADDEIRLIVRDMDSGHEHCFRVNLDTGETASCG